MTEKSLNFEELRPFEKRQFVPEGADLADLKAIKPLYEQLLAKNIESAKELEKWVLKRSELEAALDQQGSILYIRMTCQTDDESCVQAYKNFIESIVPTVKLFEDRLNKKYLDTIKKFPLDDKRYRIYTRAIQTDIELFKEDNVSLQTKVELLSQEYQAVCGAMTVDFDGREQTLQEMSKFLLEPNQGLRERAWRATSARRLQDAKKLDQIFDDMLILRDKIAHNAGFDNFRDYKFKSLHRFDYSPEDCRQYHATVERVVVPLWRQIQKHRKEKMGLAVLRPWDTAVDPAGLEPLKPFEEAGALISGCQDIFTRVDTDLGAQFAQMAGEGLLDLNSRKGKAPGGYQSTLSESRKPFIFMNAVGIDSDVRTLLHEGGHAFHALACAGDPLLDYRHGPMEFNEVASMGMELLADRYLGVFYDAQDEARSRVKHLEDIIFTLVWVATIDEFQHWIYEHPQHTFKDRHKKWLSIHKRYSGGVVDWEDLDEARANLWHRQLHIFEVPFYYIEYGIAQLGALQLWMNAKKDYAKTIGQYRSGLSLGGSRPLPELFEAAGLRFDFSESMIAPLVEEVRKELNT